MDLPYIPLTAEQRAYLRQYDNAIHWTRGNVMLMFQGKCANTAIKAAILMAEGGIDPTINIHMDPRLVYINRDHIARYRSIVPVVAVVRRPWDRIISFWRDKVAGRSHDNYTCDYIPGTFGNMPFRTFVEAALAAEPERGDLAPAHTFLSLGGASLPHEAIKFEDLVEGDGWQRLRRWTACAWDLPEKLPHFNKPKQPRPELDKDTEHRLRIAVYTRYYTDYKLFGWNA